MKPAPSLILASASPRRRDLLRAAGISFSVVPSNVSEECHRGEAPEAYTLRIAEEKAREVANRHPDLWTLAADTIVAIDGKVLGKPRDATQGKHMLRQLSGRRHQVLTAFVLINPHRQQIIRQVVASSVTFKPLSDEQIHAYLATGEPFDKAGAYAVQGQGAALVERVEGSYTNIVGLPMEEIREMLRENNLLNTEDAQSV